MSDKAKAMCGCELNLKTGESWLCSAHLAKAHRVPEGFEPFGFEKSGEVVICMWPKEDDESHNCDAMGCTTFSHVAYRGTVEDLQKRLA